MTEKDKFKAHSQLQEDMVAWRRFLHEHAEVGFDLDITKEFVLKTLSVIGVEAKTIGKAGVLATIGKRTGKGAFLLRADMDGLPIKEESGEPFSAKNGNMHACGHDLHTAMLLGATKLLKDKENEIDGCVKILFQPAEERLEGAKDVIQAGVLKFPKVCGAMMIHVLAGVPLPIGTVIVAEGVSAPACDYFTVKITGKGCHGSSPHQGVDATLIASQIAVALQTPIAREVPTGERAVLTVGEIRAGDAGNVIAEQAMLKGTLRAFDEDTRRFLKERLKAIAKSVAKAFRATAEVEIPSGCPTLMNAEALSKTAYRVLKEIGENAFLSGHP